MLRAKKSSLPYGMTYRRDYEYSYDDGWIRHALPTPPGFPPSLFSVIRNFVRKRLFACVVHAALRANNGEPDIEPAI
eukprot:scaffold158407_cov37-Prasinocladus_malaysianus.AAC.1